MTLRLLWVLVFFCISSICVGQIDPNAVIPPSPESASLGKYIESPVGTYTGVPQISIPLYEVSNRDLNVPISLSYHAGGVRVEEVASRTGLGWSLNAGGVITRSVRGNADDGIYGWLTSTKTTTIHVLDSITRLQQLTNVGNGLIDSQADIFYYNFGSYSGRFYYDESNSIQMIPYQKILIESVTGGGFVITGEDGTKYYFGLSKDGLTSARDQSTTTSACGSATPSSTTYTSSWYLLNIVSANETHSIDFGYEAYSIDHCNKSSESTTFDNCTNRPPSLCYSSTQISGQRLTSIESDTRKVTFHMENERDDLPGDHQLDSISMYDMNNQLISSYHLAYDYFVSSGSLVFNGYCNSTTDDERRRRLKLLSVTRKSSNGEEMPGHTFEYNNTELPERFSHAQDHWGYYNQKSTNTTLVPAIFRSSSYGMIYQPGADRNVDSVGVQAGILTKITYPTGGYRSFEYESNTAVVPITTFSGNTPYPEDHKQALIMGDFTTLYHELEFSVERTGTGGMTFLHLDLSNVTCALDAANGCDIQFYIKGVTDTTYSYRLLQDDVTVILPNGTYRAEVTIGTMQPEFDNFMLNLKWSNTYPATSIPVGGVRIKKITDNNDDASYGVVNNFDYSLPSSPTSGHINIVPTYQHSHQISTSTANCITVVTKSRTNIPLGASSASNVEYSNVSVLHGANGKNGKTEYVYSIEEILDDLSPFIYPFPPIAAKTWTGGRSLATIQYEKYGQNFRPLRETINVYEEHFIDTLGYAGMAIDLFIQDLTGGGVNSYIYKPFSTPTGRSDLSSSTQKTFSYDAQGVATVLETTTNHYYANDDHLQRTFTAQIDSRGKSVETRYRYPHDYPSPSAVISSMIQRNMINIPIEQIQSVNGHKVSAQATRFHLDTTTDYILPEEVFQTELTAGSTFTTSTDGTTFSDYEQSMIIDKYDDKGNVLQYTSRAGITTVMLWGYNQTLPVAKIDNATYASVEAISGFGTDFHAGIDNLSPTEEDTLRLSLSEAQITTYQYKEGIGLEQVTDPNGQSAFYHYDSFNRLRFIEDADGNVVKKVTYNYKGQ